MFEQSKPTKKQIELIKKLDKLNNCIWECNSTKEIILIAKEAIVLSKYVKPTTYILANGTEKINNKGKKLILENLENDIVLLKNRSYSSINQEKFAIYTSIQLLIGVFVHLTTEELINVLRK